MEKRGTLAITDQIKAALRLENKSLALIMLICAIYCFCLYLPLLIIPFAHHDQYRYFANFDASPAFKLACTNDIEFSWLNAIGRPLTAQIECGVFQFANTINDLSYVRGIVLALCIIVMFILQSAFKICGINRKISLVLAALIFALPAIHFHIFMGDLPNILALFTALVSFLSLENAWKIRSTKLSSPISWIFLLILSTLFLFTSLVLYPAKATFFLIPCLGGILLAQERRSMSVILRDILFFTLVAGAYFVWGKIVIARHQAGVPLGYSFVINDDVMHKLKLFLNSVCFHAFNLWNIFPRKFIAFLLTAIILFGFWRNQKQSSSQSIFSHRLNAMEILAIAVLLLIINSPFLTVKSDLVLYRVIFVFSSALCILGVWSLLHWLPNKKVISRTIFISLCLIASTLAFYASFNNALNSYAEYAFLKNKIRNEFSPQIHEIHLLRLKDISRGLNGLPSSMPQADGDEFNHLSTQYFPDISWIMTAIFDEIFPNRTFKVISCTERVCEPEIVKQNPGAIVVTDGSKAKFFSNDHVLEIDMEQARYH